jgi:hypothetical protein
MHASQAQVCALVAGATLYRTRWSGASLLNNSASTLSDEVPTFAIAPRNSFSLHPKSLHQIRTSCGSFGLIGLAHEFGALRISGFIDPALGSPVGAAGYSAPLPAPMQGHAAIAAVVGGARLDCNGSVGTKYPTARRGNRWRSRQGSLARRGEPSLF